MACRSWGLQEQGPSVKAVPCVYQHCDIWSWCEPVLGMQVALDLPSIKATLSDREYQLIQSMAGDNFGEAQRLPEGAEWLEEQYAEQQEPDQDAG